ncbi:MAG: TIGR04283 family arsenosugar biosynthesis glycosyltransferase [Gammaproteobacteria bacterium]
MESISIIIPALNEATSLPELLTRLEPLRLREGCEVIVVDGGSEDGTADIAAGRCDRLVRSSRGRARQMNAGADAASGRILWFLHADTIPPPGAVSAIRDVLAPGGAGWGRFDVRLSSRRPILRLVAWMMNHRSRLSGIATGDQAIFVRRDWFERCGGFPEIALMEDIELSRRLKRLGRPACLGERVVTSSRRWESAGVWRTILLMWRLRLAYWLGADPARLARAYRHG